MAERAGFEPAIPGKGITVFETVAFNHSATSPLSALNVAFSRAEINARRFLASLDEPGFASLRWE